MRPKRWGLAALGAVALVVAAPAAAFAQDAPTLESVAASAADNKILLDTLWTLVAAVLVFLMQAGFAMVEAGMTRTKNAANIVMKNLMDFSIASIAFWAVGFALMFGAGNALVGTTGWFLGGGEGAFDSLAWATPPLTVKWIFQAVFAGTTATIVSGAIAERTKFKSYLLISALISGIVYPISGHWIWGGGWLGSEGFLDFAGSTVVHSVGGWAALIGAIMVGPRLGKYAKDGRPNAIPGHSMPLAILGVFLLWFGWFGFNAGSTMGAVLDIGHIALTTNLAAASGSLIAMMVAWFLFKKPDVGMAGNGALAGLVGITAGAAFVEPWAAVIIGIVAGGLVVGSVLVIDRLGVDDPVGAISVHGVTGVWGTLAVGLFSAPRLTTDLGLGKSAGAFYGGGLGQLGIQALGAVAVMAYTLVAAALVFGLVKVLMGLRVDEQEEIDGLDIHEHGMYGYPEVFLGHSGTPATMAVAAAPKPTAQPSFKPALE
ncbi:MAG: ammonium transporter [Actinomycetota bacterium]